MKYILILLLQVGIFTTRYVTAVQREHVEYGHDCSQRCFPADIKDPLVCRNVGADISVCACADGLFRHNNLNRCVAPTGGVCTTKSADGLPIATCTEFAVCWSTEKNDPTLTRQNGTCHCEPDAKADPHTGQCKLKHGSNRCHNLGDCDVMAGLNCHWSTCGCQDQTYQTYNRTSGKCEALAGGECGIANPPFPAAECTGPHMKCVKGKCLCLKGYAKTIDKKCIELTETTYIYNENQHHPYPIHRGGGGGGFMMNMAAKHADGAVAEAAQEDAVDEVAEEDDTPQATK